MTQNHAGNHVGSSPTIGTNDVSVRTNRTDRHENQSIKWLIFFIGEKVSNTKQKKKIYNQDNIFINNNKNVIIVNIEKKQEISLVEINDMKWYKKVWRFIKNFSKK